MLSTHLFGRPSKWSRSRSSTWDALHTAAHSSVSACPRLRVQLFCPGPADCDPPVDRVLLEEPRGLKKRGRNRYAANDPPSALQDRLVHHPDSKRNGVPHDVIGRRLVAGDRVKIEEGDQGVLENQAEPSPSVVQRNGHNIADFSSLSAHSATCRDEVEAEQATPFAGRTVRPTWRRSR